MAAQFWASQRPIVAAPWARHKGANVRVFKIGVLRAANLQPRATCHSRHLTGSRPICGLMRPFIDTARHIDRRHGRNMAATWPQNSTKSGQNQARSKGKKPLLMTLYIFPKKSIITLFRYCIYTALYNHSTTFSLLYMYSNTKSLHKNDDFLAHIEVDPPLPIFLRPIFTKANFQ
jgi:hypothetical protein